VSDHATNNYYYTDLIRSHPQTNNDPTRPMDLDLLPTLDIAPPLRAGPSTRDTKAASVQKARVLFY